MLKDGIVLEDNGDSVVFNQYSFCELIKHLLCYYVGVSYEESSEIVDHSHLVEPISNVIEAVLLAHEYPYYWAMSLYYGHMYWEKGIAAQPDDLDVYIELEDDIIKKYKLNEPFEFD